MTVSGENRGNESGVARRKAAMAVLASSAAADIAAHLKTIALPDHEDLREAENGLVMLNANPYLYLLVNSVIIFIAAWVDGRRRLMTERLEQRKIRVEA